jgi:lysozyme
MENLQIEFKPPERRRPVLIAFLLIAFGVIAYTLGYFVMYQTGHIHVTRTLDNGALFSGYWKMGEPFGEGVLITTAGELIEGVWDDDGHLNSGVVIAREFTYMGALKDYLPQGYGVCHYKNGTKYFGFWENGVKNGLGKLLTAKGDIAFGEWRKGELPPAKGQQYATGEQVYGIDVSNHQYNIDWERLALYADSTGSVKANVKESPYLQPVLFAFIKSTEGADWVADTFERNFIEARRCGIPRGAYHFLRLSDIDAQIKNFIDHTPLEPGDLPPVLDIELDNRTMAKYHDKAVEYAHKWLDAMEKHYGVKPILYTYDSYYNSYLKGHGFDDYDFFIARYNPETMPRVPHLEIWQFTEDGHAGGIKTQVDLDIFSGNYHEFEKYVAEKGIPDTPTTKI